MNTVLLFVTSCFVSFQVIDSRKVRGIIMTEESFDYIFDYHLDKRVPSFNTYFSRKHLEFEQIDDDKIMASGYVECLKSMDPNMKLQTTIRTQFYQNSKWNEGPAQLVLMDMCKEYRNPTRFWYNYTKLITPDVCPPKKGDKWYVTNNTIVDSVVEVPTIPMVPWRGYVKVFQGMPGFEKYMYGFGVQVELVVV